MRKRKGSGVFSHDPFGRPRGRSVDSTPNCFAMRRTQLSSTRKVALFPFLPLGLNKRDDTKMGEQRHHQ